MRNIFVYGTLKKGFGLDYYLESSAYVGKAKISGALLYSFGSIPYVVETNNEEDVVYGEVYMVEQVDGEIIDSIELASGYYVLKREAELDNGDKFECDVYFRPPSKYGVFIEDGEFR